MATAAATPEVFTRKASGLVRVMSPYSAFIYNILTMGLIFPWTYLWAPGALPGGKLVWGILLATVFEIPIAFAYVWLSTALPRSGGDYVFQSRAFGGFWGFTLLMSGFVIWILQWVALSGWLLSYLGFAPLFLGLGATTGNAALSEIGVWFTGANGIIITSIVNAFLSMLLLVSGFKNYVKVQYVMFYGILVAFATTLIVLFTTPQAEFVTRLNEFAVRSGGVQNFYQAARDAVVGAGIDLNPPFSMLATLLVAPIAWTSLQWATYSAEQNGEIKEARSFKNQVFILVGSLIVTGILLALLAMAFERAGGTEFVYIAGAGYWSLIPEASISGFNLWPNILAVALTASPLVVLLIAFGYILNSFQIVNNCYIGVTRIMVAMSLDRLLPEWVSKVHERLHTPVNAHLVYFLASIPVIWAYNKVGGWIGLTLGVTFACGYVFAATSLAGAVLPFRAKEVYDASPGASYKVNGLAGLVLMVIGAAAFVWTTWEFAAVFAATPILLWLVRLLGLAAAAGVFYMFRGQLGGWVRGTAMPWVTALGTAGAGVGFAMVVAFLLAPQLGVLGNWDFSNLPSSLWSQIIAFGILILSAVWYFAAKAAQKRRGINVDYAFKEIPPE
ncbi:MAG TPA: APC family permease [Anaerolineales bacterium]|nr:APC family permease [Anaerolineales bacterium]